MQANVGDVCRFFGVPPEAIGGSSGDSMTYANVEGRNLSLLTNTVGAWMQWFERTLASMLPRPQLVELDPKALLRTSVTTNFDNAQKAIGQNGPGIASVDESRGIVGLPPIGGEEGGRFFVPSNYVPADLIDEVVAPDQGMVGNGEPVAAA
jgi:phage portal protein BeeE